MPNTCTFWNILFLWSLNCMQLYCCVLSNFKFKFNDILKSPGAHVAYPSARGMRIVATQRTIEGHETSHCRSLHKSAPRNTSPRRVSLFYDVSVVNDFAVALRSIRSALCRNSVNRNAVVVGALRECIAGSHLMSYRLSISTVQTPAVVWPAGQVVSVLSSADRVTCHINVSTLLTTPLHSTDSSAAYVAI